MLRLGLDGGGDGEDGEREAEADCGYYLRTGACGFGECCRYNHDRDHGGTEPLASSWRGTCEITRWDADGRLCNPNRCETSSALAIHSTGCPEDTFGDPLASPLRVCQLGTRDHDQSMLKGYLIPYWVISCDTDRVEERLQEACSWMWNDGLDRDPHTDRGDGILR